ncbi:MAG: class I SAM-dependent methyltransferase [Acidimicrobiales bacterium]|jgi:SAM-dependent methyltransferase|nr:class I SAM-dependent methyltransferase [Acidimicrobiales bacterium]
MSRWSERDDVQRGADYDERWRAMAAAGQSIHGEADLVSSLVEEHGLGDNASVLDAGCGTGRLAIELEHRGHDVVGVDLDAPMLDEARAKAPAVMWVLDDLLSVDLQRRFDAVVMAGNVMIFVAPGTEAGVVANMARHVRPSGLLVAGFQTGGSRLSADDYDRHAEASGLARVARWATWGREPFAGGDYAVFVHIAPGSSST